VIREGFAYHIALALIRDEHDDPEFTPEELYESMTEAVRKVYLDKARLMIRVFREWQDKREGILPRDAIVTN